MDLPPMQPQNVVLEILDTIEPHGAYQHNGILVFSTSSQMQVVTFKNAKYVGEKIIPLPALLDKKLQEYLNVIQPAYGMFAIYTI
jgi:hypothetical protein